MFDFDDSTAALNPLNDINVTTMIEASIVGTIEASFSSNAVPLRSGQPVVAIGGQKMLGSALGATCWLVPYSFMSSNDSISNTLAPVYSSGINNLF